MGVFDRKSADGADTTAVPGDAHGEKGRLSGRLGSWIGRSGGLVASVADSVKEVSRGGLLRQALEARDRGNLGAAFHLAREEHDVRPDDDDVASIFWDIAVAYGRPESAADGVGGLIRRRATAGALELAAQYWAELHEHLPDALLEPTTFARLIPQLAEQAEVDRNDAAAEGPATPLSNDDDEESRVLREATQRMRAGRAAALAAALRGVVDERNSGLTAGLAFRVAELARDLDAETALRAARFAVSVEDLHEAKRQRLLDLIAGLDAAAPNVAPPAPDVSDTSDLSDISEVSDDEIAEELAEFDTAAGLDEDVLADASETSDTEESAEDDPARNHPARVVSPPAAPLSEDELEALQAKLPPSRTPAVQAEAADPVDDGVETEARAPEAGDLDAEVDVAAELEVDVGIEVEEDAASDGHPDADPKGGRADDFDFGVDDHPLDLDASGPIAPSPAGPAVARPTATPVFDVALDDSIVIEADEELRSLDAVADPELALFADVKAVTAMPLSLDADRLVFAMPDGRQTAVELERIEAIAVAEVGGLADTPVVIVDLALDWRTGGDGPLRTVRLRSDALNTAALAPGVDDPGDALRSVLTTLMERTRAIPLPDPDAALGLMIPAYTDIGAYEREVLQIAR